MDMDFLSDDLAISRLVQSIDTQGFAVVENALSAEQLAEAQAFVDRAAEDRGGEYFAIHGREALAGGLLGELGNSPELQTLMAQLFWAGSGRAPSPNERIFPVLRCLQGQSGLKESHFFHFDATLVTALLPIMIPQTGVHRGELMIFRNRRPVRSGVLTNLIDKALMQNRFSQKLIVTAVKRRWLEPVRVSLVPGHLYLFWGYRSLHSNNECDPSQRRATVLYHYGDPHFESALGRRLLGSNKRHANLDYEGRRAQPAPGVAGSPATLVQTLTQSLPEAISLQPVEKDQPAPE